MGRPALGNKATQVRLGEAVRAQIEALCGKRGMAKFIRDAVDEKLARASVPQPSQEPPPPSPKPRRAGKVEKAASKAPAGSGATVQVGPVRTDYGARLKKR